jgi:hypothetical protein
MCLWELEDGLKKESRRELHLLMCRQLQVKENSVHLLQRPVLPTYVRLIREFHYDNDIMQNVSLTFNATL